MSYGMAETFFTAEELVLSEIAHRRVGVAERVRLGEELGEAGRVCLGNLLKGVPAKSGGCERTAGLLNGGVGIDRPGGFREPADELDLVDPAGEALAEEHGSAGPENAADFSRGSFQVRDMVDHEGQPGAVRRAVWKREGAGVALQHLDVRSARNLGPHRRRRFDREDAETEPVAEGSGERTGPRADVHQSHPVRRAQVTSYCLAPLRESVAWDLADRLEGCSRLLVIADPGHVSIMHPHAVTGLDATLSAQPP